MDYFRIVGEGAQSPHPIEKVVTSAIEAQAESSALRRLCGRYGRVEVWNKQGRACHSGTAAKSGYRRARGDEPGTGFRRSWRLTQLRAAGRVAHRTQD